MKHARLAERYAGALFLNLEGEADQNTAVRILHEMAKLYTTHHDFNAAISNPAIKRDERAQLVEAILEGDQVPEVVTRLLTEIVRRGRAALIPAIAELLTGLVDDCQNCTRAQVRAAFPLDEEQAARVKSALEQRTGKEVRIELEIEPELLGGVVADVDGVRYDGSARHHLNRLRDALLPEEQLNR